MYQTMEGNARPHRTAQCLPEESQDGAQSQAELLHALQSVSENIMRLAGKLRGERDATADDAQTMTEQHALAQQLIGRLLTLPASRT
ncbi:hypothetical protein AWB77_03758 [Caballeronia fortuita]|uniref:Uncharacterized protein n=1 Tax=Caballeronia fortuita TaxID=1777138 RepID=A0A158C7X4_9BURK|nr:hypothetical protein [Caballeronia fortuita]SAK78392.1 hypothetical protein AWB77_03758 [Caballeronia fortuita]